MYPNVPYSSPSQIPSNHTDITIFILLTGGKKEVAIYGACIFLNYLILGICEHEKPSVQQLLISMRIRGSEKNVSA